MNDAVKSMLEKYDCRSTRDYENALKEIIQETALLGLWRSKFFEKAAFYGGSALRILYGLDRFSEDLDFSLLEKDEHFSLGAYCRATKDELTGMGFSVSVEQKKKTLATHIDSTFIKAGTLENLLVIDFPRSAKKNVHAGKLMKIKLEVDKTPPGGFTTEAKYILCPMPFSVNTYTLPSLFAGKMHAILCRPWATRVKGRDWYDLVWYVGKNVPVNLTHLESRMKQTGHLTADEQITEGSLHHRLQKRIAAIDFASARKDVELLVKDRAALTVWSKDFFSDVCRRISSM